MGGSFRTESKLFLDRLRAGQKDMERVCSIDPTPALKQRVESRRELLGKLERQHERFERLMRMSDAELQAMNSDERSGPMLGERELVSKISRRKMGEEEYSDLTEGPDIAEKKK